MALIQPRPPIPGTPPDDGDFDERESIAMEGKIMKKTFSKTHSQLHDFMGFGMQFT